MTLDPSANLPADEDQLDPDPFSIGLAIFAALAGGGAFLEARRQRQIVEAHRREDFRGSWYGAQRTVLHFKQNIDEFESYVLEERLGTRQFRIGAVRLMVDAKRHRSLRRLRGQTMTTAHLMGDTLDDLSDYLGPEDQARITEILERLGQFTFPQHYAEVIAQGREAVSLYMSLLDAIDERQHLEIAKIEHMT